LRLLLLLILPLFAAADTIDGVSYTWQWEPLGDYAGDIHVQFSAPISSYQFQVTFTTDAVNPQVWGGAGQDLATVTWATVQGSGWVPGGQVATVTGNAPDVTSMTAEIAESSQAQGNLFPLNFHFTNLVDPPVGAADAPEPSTIWLALPIVGILGKFGRRIKP
jgi:hypothetical protein